MTANQAVVVAVVLTVILLVRRGSRRAVSYHRSLVSQVKGLLLLAGLLALGMWLLNTRYGGS
jgi:hypothetical protein